MSIKGIDAQIMVTRTAELSKESSNQIKRNELMQDYMSVQGRLMEEHEKQMVTGLQEAQEAVIQREREGSRGGADPEERDRRSGSSLSDQELAEELDGGEDHLIDIKV